MKGSFCLCVSVYVNECATQRFYSKQYNVGPVLRKVKLVASDTEFSILFRNISPSILTP